jgi:hypothetical protein
MLFILTSLSVPAVEGISISIGGNGGSYSTGLSLADKTSLRGDIHVLEDAIVGNLQAIGSGQNAISCQVSGSNSNARSVTITDGAFGFTSSADASGSGLQLSASLDCTGSAMTKVSGATGNDAADQQAVLDEGAISSSQSVIAGDGILASQGTAMRGKAGYLVSAASSPDNFISSDTISKDDARYVAASFEGDGGDMAASLVSAAGQGAFIDGTVSTAGNPIGVGLQNDDVGVAVNGLYPTSEGRLGKFDMLSVNLKGSKASAATKKKLLPTYYINDPRSYALAGWRWGANPNLAFTLFNDINCQKTSLKADEIRTSIAGAAATWDAATSQNLFSGSVTSASSGLSLTAKDGKNTIGWIPKGGALAVARTYLRGIDAKGYYIPLESDICFNTNYKWVTSDTAKSYPQISNTFDFQTVALHELGHTYGLGDLYTLPSTDPRYRDYSEIMNSYNDKQRTLGKGDVAGIQAIYGK